MFKIRTKKEKRGFTLVELLVVIGIIALLATLSAVATSYARRYANRTKAEADLATLAKAIEQMVLDTGQWPNHETPYEVCNNCSNNEIEDLSIAEAGIMETDGLYTNWKGPYMQFLSIDPWGNGYFYDSDYEVQTGVEKAVLGSYGPNGRGLNEYDDDDIIFVISR